MDKQAVCKAVPERDCRFKSCSLHQWVGSLTVKHLVVNEKDCGSNPLQPSKLCTVHQNDSGLGRLVQLFQPCGWLAQFGRVPVLQAGCCRFKSYTIHQKAHSVDRTSTLVSKTRDTGSNPVGSANTVCSVNGNTPDCLSGVGVQIPQAVPSVLSVSGNTSGFQPGVVSSSLTGRSNIQL